MESFNALHSIIRGQRESHLRHRTPLNVTPAIRTPLPLSRAVAGDTDLPTRCENICRLDVIKTKSATSINFCGGWGMHSGEPKVWKPYHHL